MKSEVDRLLAERQRIVREVRSHLSEEDNERASDKLIWQRAITFGPSTPEECAEKLRNAFAAADEYGEELGTALGLAPQSDPGVPSSGSEGE